MKPMYRGLLVAAVQCGIVLSLAGKYALDHARLPRVWVRTTPVDPDSPLRGRYVRLRLALDGTVSAADRRHTPVRLSIIDGRLATQEDVSGSSLYMSCSGTRGCWLEQPVAFFIPEHVSDPSRVKSGEELWVEVSVPKDSYPRPVRLGVKQYGMIRPLDVR